MCALYEAFEKTLYGESGNDWETLDLSVSAYGGDVYGGGDYGAPVKTPEKKNDAEQQQTAKPSDADILARFYWNERLQMLLERPAFSSQEDLQRQEDIRELLERFVRAATPVVETIVEEAHLPVAEKTIRPIDVGGIAGGTKFIHRNLFIKFCADENTSLYGTAHFAQKAASHEIKALNALISTNTSRLHFPLMALFSCRGFRLMCVSKLPISQKTLVYGSCDAGRSVYTDKEFGKLLRRATKELNLKPHYVVDSCGIPKEVYGPVDLEGHLGADRRYYVCDAARLFPPTLPMRGVPGCHLYKLFRQEYLKLHCQSTPLSSDAFSNFGRHDREIHNIEAKNATSHLLIHVVHLIASNAADWLKPGCDIKAEVHRLGLNLRFLGYVLLQLSDEQQKTLLVIEMTARVVKNELHALMRANKDQNVYGEFLNQRFFGVDVWQHGWAADAVLLFSRYFEFCRTPTFNDKSVVEGIVGPCLRQVLQTHRRDVLKRSCDLAGVELKGLDLDSISLEVPLISCSMTLYTKVKRMHFETISTEQKSAEELEAVYLKQLEHSNAILPALNLALLYAFHGRWEDCRAMFDRALDIAGGNRLVECEIKERRLFALYVMEPQGCMELIRSVISMKRAIGIELELASSLDVAASVALFIRDFVAALSWCDEAAALKKSVSVEDAISRGKTDLLRAKILFHKGALQDAWEVLLRLEASFLSMPDRAKKVRGDLFELLGLVRAAMDASLTAGWVRYFESAIAAKKEVLGSMHVSLAQLYSNFGVVLCNANSLSDAETYFSKAIMVCSSIGARSSYTHAIVLRNQAALLQKKGDLDAARKNVTLALALLQPNAPILQDLKLALESGNFAGGLFHSEDMTLFTTNVGLSLSLELLSQEILDLLAAAGVTKKDLADAEQLEVIFTCLLESLGEVTETMKSAEDAGYTGYQEEKEEEAEVAESERNESSEVGMVIESSEGVLESGYVDLVEAADEVDNLALSLNQARLSISDQSDYKSGYDHPVAAAVSPPRSMRSRIASLLGRSSSSTPASASLSSSSASTSTLETGYVVDDEDASDSEEIPVLKGKVVAPRGKAGVSKPVPKKSAPQKRDKEERKQPMAPRRQQQQQQQAKVKASASPPPPPGGFAAPPAAGAPPPVQMLAAPAAPSTRLSAASSKPSSIGPTSGPGSSKMLSEKRSSLRKKSVSSASESLSLNVPRKSKLASFVSSVDDAPSESVASSDSSLRRAAVVGDVQSSISGMDADSKKRTAAALRSRLEALKKK